MDKKNRNKDIAIIALVYAILFLGGGMFMYKTENKWLKQEVNTLRLEMNEHDFKIQNYGQ